MTAPWKDESTPLTDKIERECCKTDAPYTGLLLGSLYSLERRLRAAEKILERVVAQKDPYMERVLDARTHLAAARDEDGNHNHKEQE